MGYGDALMVCALARNIRLKQPDQQIAVVYISSRYGKPDGFRLPELDIYRNNPSIDIATATTRLKFLIRRCFGDLKGKRILNAPKLAESYRERLNNGRFKYIRIHATENLCNLFHVPCKTRCPELILDKEENDKVDAILGSHGLEPGAYIVIEPQTKDSDSTKRWPDEHWQALIDLLKNKYPQIKCVNIGPGKIDVQGLIDVSGKTSFRESARFVQQAKLIVASEGGLGHLAAAMGTASVIVHSGFTPVGLTAYEKEKTVYHPVACAPCGISRDCPLQHQCMQGLKPDKVFTSIVEMIEGR